MWREYNNNPAARSVGDCSVRALSAVFGIDWDSAYMELADAGLKMADIMNSNATINAVMRMHGYTKVLIPNSCPDCYTIDDFCKDNPHGKYVVGTGSHVVAVINGDIYDSWDSRNEIPIYAWYEKYVPTFYTDRQYGLY